MQGDHEFFSNHLKLPHWASKYPCWECNAENFEGCKATLNVKGLDLDKSKFKSFSQKEQLGKASHLEHPLFQVPGVTAKTCRVTPCIFCSVKDSMAMSLEVYYITCAGMKGLERFVRKGHPKGLGSSSMKSSRNTSPKVWSTGSQILSSACLQMLKSLGLEKPPWTAKQVKASICFQPWFLSWKRCLLGPKKKKRKNVICSQELGKACGIVG